MAAIFEDDFRSYASRDDLPWQYDIAAPTSGALIETNGTRKMVRLLGTYIARSIAPMMRDVSIHALIMMTAETSNTTTQLFRIGVNPPGAPLAAQVSGAVSGYLFVDFTRTLMRVQRVAYLPDGTMTGSRQTMASVTLPTTINPGAACRVEIRVNETNATCHMTVILNGVVLADFDYAREMNGQACNLGIGSFTIFAASTGSSSPKALVGDIVIYKSDTDTPFPLGNIQLIGLDAGVTGEVITDNKEFDLPDIASISGTIAGVSLYGRMESVGITSRTGRVSAIVDGGEVAAGGRQIVSGILTPDVRVNAGKLTLAQINAMKIGIGVL